MNIKISTKGIGICKTTNAGPCKIRTCVDINKNGGSGKVDITCNKNRTNRSKK